MSTTPGDTDDVTLSDRIAAAIENGEETTLSELSEGFDEDLTVEVLADALGLVHQENAKAALMGEELTATDGLEDYGTGVAYEAEGGVSGNPDKFWEDVDELLGSVEGDLDAYGTGVSGDTSREEYERRQDILEALEEYEKRKGDE